MASADMAQAQAEMKDYLEQHQLEDKMTKLFNSLVHAQDPHPKVYIIKYLLASADLKLEDFPSYLAQAGVRDYEESKGEGKGLVEAFRTETFHLATNSDIDSEVPAVSQSAQVPSNED